MITKQNNALNYITQLLYTLKKDYGYPLELYRYTNLNLDTVTGKREITREVIKVSRAIVLPSTLARRFEYDRTFIAGNKDFSYGASFDVNTRQVLIDAKDLSKNFDIELDYSAIYENARYQVKTLERIDCRLAYILTLVKTKGSLKEEVFNLRVGNTLGVTQKV